MRYNAAIFDMDGTTLDTVGDLTDAVNHTMRTLGLKDGFSYEDAKLFFGSGVTVALTRAFALMQGIASGYELLKVGTEDDPISPKVDKTLLKKAEEIYKPYYSSHNAIKTGEYPGISPLLKDLRANGVKTAVVSNKPHDSVLALSDRLFNGLFDACLGEQQEIKRKPAPDMTLKILNELQVSREDAVYIGDSEIDLETARNSGLACIAVTWGFRNREFLKEHGAVMIVDSTEEILDLIIG
ncbi:MAG: HAD family hydrolase [Lachnospiraceae bacterium]|nr:HAD family hydrolase [Lachnospiraceae bacterium]